jgi:hypothetical protein
MGDRNVIWDRLKAPFPSDDVQWRCARAGTNSRGEYAQVLAYIDNRAVMDRLDTVFGAENWKNEFRVEADGIICRIYYKMDDADEWRWKEDGASKTEFEPFKGGLSDAMKRCAAQLGIGRYLYSLESTYVQPSSNGKYTAEYKDGGEKKRFKWNPPALPGWAVPKTVREAVTERTVPDLSEGRIKVGQLIERYEPVLSPAAIQSVLLDMDAAKTVEDMRGIYSHLKKMGEDYDRAATKEHTKESVRAAAAAYANKEPSNAEEFETDSIDVDEETELF